MEWQGQRESENVEVRGGLGGTGVAIGGGGIATALIVMACWALGFDPTALVHGPARQGTGPPARVDPVQEKFVRVVLASTEDVWTDLFKKMGKTYRKPKLVIFQGKVQSACGLADAAVGPFYCPADQEVYLDLEFFAELRTRFKAPGEFAEAYVIAHEVGHHVQKLLGISDWVDKQRPNLSKTERNKLSVRLELQADFLAGIWGHYAKDQFKLNANDIQSAITAANAIGDDRLQMQAKGYVVPDAFTHGTSEQRVRWFRTGFETGDLQRKDELFKRPYDKL
jgi:predicted metalloprotease